MMRWAIAIAGFPNFSVENHAIDVEFTATKNRFLLTAKRRKATGTK
jgi:hypothetical protein